MDRTEARQYATAYYAKARCFRIVSILKAVIPAILNVTASVLILVSPESMYATVSSVGSAIVLVSTAITAIMSVPKLDPVESAKENEEAGDSYTKLSMHIETDNPDDVLKLAESLIERYDSPF